MAKISNESRENYEKKIKPDYNHYMGLVFERICKEFLEKKNDVSNDALDSNYDDGWNNPVEDDEEIPF